MFYVESETPPRELMDISKLVQKKLAIDEVCLQCVECALLEGDKRSLRYAAVVERQDEYGVFLFSSSRVPCLQSGDLDLEQTIAVDSRLRCHAEAPPKQKKPQPDFILGLKSPDLSVILEMPQQESTQLFLAELRRAQDCASTRVRPVQKSVPKIPGIRPILDLHGAVGRGRGLFGLATSVNSQNAAFGSAPDFAWLEKYTQQSRFYLASATTTSSSTDNPFADDVFDPLKHMNINQVNSHVVASDVASTTKTTWFDNTFEAALTENAKHRSRSRDSLDNLLDSVEDNTDSVQSKYGMPILRDVSGGMKPLAGRENIVRKILTDREEEFTDLKTFKVFCGSWNVNGQSPAEALHKWIVVDNEPPDIYAIGFQELDLSKEAFIFSDSPKEKEWQNAVKSYLHPKAKYQKVKSVRLVGVMLLVYIQEKHVPHISAIGMDSVATGIMGIMGNKGGVSIRFTLHSTSMCFVCSHLAAHQDEFERRNQDYRDIDSKTKFKEFEPPLSLSQHDIIYWIGDLNYRIEMPIDDVKNCIQKGLYKRLCEHDQLVRQMRACSDVFKGYEEGLLAFDPTYKFDAGTDQYDSSEKNRIPAWCDRILWRGPNVQQLRYDSHPHLRVSDHKPVSALFNTGIRVIDQNRYKKVYEDIMKRLDRMENDCLPQIKLDKTECIFKDVKFTEGQVEVVTVANIGQVPVEFEFINKLDDQSYCRPWLKVTPFKSIILEGHCCEVQVEVYVDKSTASRLNSGEEKMEDILVLHLANGKDSFITVTGNYLTSSFGSSIEALVQMHSPIREVPVANLLQIERPGSLSLVDISQDGGRLYMIPKEIWKLVDFIHKYGLDTDDLFQQHGRATEMELIQDCLDTGVPHLIPEALSVHSVAESLLLFLECLGQPIIPYEFYTQCLASSNNLMLSKQLISALPDCHKNVFHYICAFLRELIKHSDNNGLSIKFLSTMFGEVLLRAPITPASTPTSSAKAASAKEKRLKLRDEEVKKAAFMYHFLSQDLDP